MFDEIKQLFRAAVKAFGERIKGVEDRVEAAEKDVAELKSFVDSLKGGGLDDLKAEIEGIAKPADPAPAPAFGDHPDPDMAAAGLPAAGPLPTAA